MKLKNILDSIYEGILIADKSGVVTYINSSYTKITGVKEKDIVGKKLIDVRPGSKLTSVIETGKKHIGHYREVGKSQYVVNMCPIIDKNRVIGGVSILNEANEFYEMAENLKLSNAIIESLKQHVKTLGQGRYSFHDIIAEDEKSIELKKKAKKISELDSNILITGESGTGKELYASSIHNTSNRKELPFFPINCASLEKNLIESELFGYESGAFTGAKEDGKLGIFQMAEGGTIFLDEISELDYFLQGKLLRVIQERTIRKIGGTDEIPVNFRLICATNKDLKKMSQENRFREDLYYRIASVPLDIHPLRERKKDITVIAYNFLEKLNKKYNKNILFSKDVENIFENYSWPGNIRELKNTIEFVFNIIEGERIEEYHLPEIMRKKKYVHIEFETLEEATKKFEETYIRQLLEKYPQTLEGKKNVAKILNISLATLYNKLTKSNQ